MAKWDELKGTLLYEQARKEIEETVPRLVREKNMAVPLHAVLELMMASWVRGASWAAENELKSVDSE